MALCVYALPNRINRLRQQKIRNLIEILYFLVIDTQNSKAT